LTVSALTCANLSYSRIHLTTVPVWSNAITLHCYHCSTNTLRSSSFNHVRILMRHGMTDSAGPPKQPRDALSALIVETSLNLILQLGSTSPSYCALLCASVTSRTGQRRSLIIFMTRRLCGPSLTSCLKQHNSLHPPYTLPPFLLISFGQRSTRYVWKQQTLRHLLLSTVPVRD